MRLTLQYHSMVERCSDRLMRDSVLVPVYILLHISLHYYLRTLLVFLVSHIHCIRSLFQIVLLPYNRVRARSLARSQKSFTQKLRCPLLIHISFVCVLWQSVMSKRAQCRLGVCLLLISVPWSLLQLPGDVPTSEHEDDETCRDDGARRFKERPRPLCDAQIEFGIMCAHDLTTLSIIQRLGSLWPLCFQWIFEGIRNARYVM